MNYVDRIIDVFGGVRRLARELGCAPSTVQSWRDRGSIPDHRKQAVLRAAEEASLPLQKADFFPCTGDPA